MPDGSIGLVLSGGGARGAYEVGVLKHIAEHLPQLLERVTVVTGTSVGAVNAMHLASHGLTPEAVRQLAALWSGLKIDELIHIAPKNVARLFGAALLRFVKRSVRSPAAGMLYADPLWKLIAREIDWPGLQRQLDRNRFDAVAIASTDIRTGQTHVWVQGKAAQALEGPTTIGDFIAIPSRLTLRHVLASAAIPLLFSPIRIGSHWHMDGGIRHNTPLGPALHLGAESLLIVSVRGQRQEVETDTRFPGVGQIVGKLLDSIFLDRVAFDLDRLQRINDVVEAAEALGEDEARRFQAQLNAMGRPAYRSIRYASVHPSQNIGLLAADEIRKSESLSGVSFLRVLGALFEDDAHASGDAASFLLFDGPFTRALMDLGEQDARTAHHQLARL